MPKKSNPRAAKIGASNLAVSSLTATQSKSSAILKHAFAPSHFQLNLFASVVQGLESQILRVHDTLSGRLTSEHNLTDGGKISCLRWGRYYGAPDRPAKKRKTQAGSADTQQGDVVIAIGFANESSIDLYSPLKGKTVATLVDAHSQGVHDICFAQGDQRKAWSLGRDGTLAEWNVDDGSLVETTTLPPSISSSKLLTTGGPTIFAADTSIYKFEPSSSADFETFRGFSSQIHSLFLDVKDGTDSPSAILGASEDERNMMVLEIESGGIRGTLVAKAAIDNVAISHTGSKTSSSPILVAVNKNGSVDVFDRPFHFKKGADKKSLKLKSKKPTGSIQITRPNGKESVSVLGASFDGDDLVLAWVEGGASPTFHRLAWRDATGKLLIDGDVNIEKSKSDSGLTNAKMNGVDLVKGQVDDTHTVIVRADEGTDLMDVDGPETIAISDAEDESSDEEEDSPVAKTLTNGVHNDEDEDDNDENMDDADDDVGDAEDEDQEPSFGDLLRAKAPGPVDIASAFTSKAQTALVPQYEKSLTLPSGMSLGTVLAQALRTNDRGLLETCFHTQELDIVRATIERLDSTLAGDLLMKLAERFHNRPGRAGSLQVWIQHTLVAHGGYLASQPKVVKQLRELHEVIKERAQSLSALLMLKGKLDMLDAQMRLRKHNQQRTRVLQAAREEQEEYAIYVEGQEDESSGDEGVGPAPEDIDFDSDEDDVEGEEMPLTMNMDGDEEDGEDDDDDDDDGEGLIDDEAEETEDDEGLEDEIDHDDVDSADEIDSESDADSLPGFEGERQPKVNGVAKKR